MILKVQHNIRQLLCKALLDSNGNGAIESLIVRKMNQLSLLLFYTKEAN